jgi:polyhydroxybutyrate depolymerase
MVRPLRAALRSPLPAALVAAGVMLAAACSSSSGAGTGGSAAGTTATSSTGAGGTVGDGGRPMDPPITVSLQGRMYDTYLPPDLQDGGTSTTPVPLFLELHGFVSATETMTPWLEEEMANQFIPEAQKRGIITVLPHGSYDPELNHFYWNATNACCDLDGLMPNDIGYLMAVIKDVESKYSVDPKRIFAFGHSNGGFMVNRMGCDQADKIAAIVSLAGETYLDQSECAASAPIGFLQVQGTADMTVPYGGGHPENVATLPIAPGAVVTTQDWAKKNDCNPVPNTTEPQITLMTTSTTTDTAKTVYEKGCEENGETELWTIHNGPHSPSFNASWPPAVFDFLMAHPKP